MNFTKPKRRVDRIFIHCSAHDSDAPAKEVRKQIKEWHTTKPPKGRGWNDIGYHYVMASNGTIVRGRSTESTPAAQYRHNLKTLAICVVGLTQFTQAQMASLRQFCREINEAYEGRISFHGHCEVSNKSCPVFDYKTTLGLDRFGRMA